MFGKSNNTVSDAQIKVVTILGEDAVFEGHLTAKEAVRIDGTIKGDCACEKEFIVGQSGHITGNITEQNVIISGRVEGDIAASGKLELLSTGKLIGNITAKSLVVDENACFDGRCTMASTNTDSFVKNDPVSLLDAPEETNGKKR